MKRPQKIVRWLHVEKEEREPFVDYNGKPLYKYFVSLPYWIIQSFREPFYVRVEISKKHPCWVDMKKDEDSEEVKKYFKKYWSKKMGKMRKLNHNYMLISTQAMGKGWFKSLEDFNNYHRELGELNKKYLTDNLPLPVDNKEAQHYIAKV